MTSFYAGEVRASRSVLIVEPDDGVRAGLAAFFEDHGYIAELARDGQEGLDILARLKTLPCLIALSDATPRLGGAEFLARQSADQRLSGIPVALMADHQQSWRADLRAATRVLKKPVDPSDLLELAQSYCG